MKILVVLKKLFHRNHNMKLKTILRRKMFEENEILQWKYAFFSFAVKIMLQILSITCRQKPKKTVWLWNISFGFHLRIVLFCVKILHIKKISAFRVRSFPWYLIFSPTLFKFLFLLSMCWLFSVYLQNEVVINFLLFGLSLTLDIFLVRRFLSEYVGNFMKNHFNDGIWRTERKNIIR